MGKKYLVALVVLLAISQGSPAFAEETSHCADYSAAFPSEDDFRTEYASLEELQEGSVLSSGESLDDAPEFLFSPTSTSENWAGYVTVASASQSYRAVSARYIIPAVVVNPSSACSGAAYGGWVGIGGYAQPRLMQIGFAYSSSSNSTRIFEMICNSAYGCSEVKTGFGSLNYAVGDQLEFTLVFAPTPNVGARAGTLTTTVTNWSPNVGLNSYTHTFSSSNLLDYYDGTAAEWIDEAPSSSTGAQLPLANFVKSYWSAAKVMDEQTRTWGTIASENETKIVMFNLNRLAVLASPSDLITSNSFTVSYLQCR